MTLHEAIEKVLKQSGRPMTAREIADEINKQKLYQRDDGNLVPTSQIHARIKNYGNLFSKSDGQIALRSKQVLSKNTNVVTSKKPKFFKRSDLTLHEAIQKVLEQNERPMTAKEIADEVNRQELYQRSDGEPVPSSQIRARVKNYPFLFERNGNMIGLSVSIIKESESHYIVKNESEIIKLVNINLYNLPNVSELGSLILTIQLLISLKKLQNWNNEIKEQKVIPSFEGFINLLANSEVINDFDYLKEYIHDHIDSFRSLNQFVFPFLYDFVVSLNEEDILRILKENLNNSSYFDKSKSGQYITPDFISSVLVKITNPKDNEMVFDPFAGWCGSLLAAYKLNNNVKLVGQEISREVAEIGKLNLMLQGLEDFQVSNSDSVKFPVLDHNSANVILSDLPYGIGISEEFDYDFERLSNNNVSISLSIEMMLSRLEPNSGRMAVAISEGFLTNGSTRKLREHIIENDLLETIISLPAGSIRYSEAKSLIIVINTQKRKELKNRVLFIKAEEDKNISKLAKLDDTDYQIITRKLAENITNAYLNLRDVGNVRQFIAKSENITRPSYDLKPNRYDPELIETIDQVDKSEKYVKLSDLLEAPQAGSLYDYQGDVKVVQISDLNDKGLGFYLNQDGLIRKESDKSQYKVLAESALLIAKIGNKLKPTYFKFKGEPIAIINNILAYKVKAKKINIEYLISQLNSGFFIAQMLSIRTGAAIPYFKSSDFLHLMVPMPSLADQLNKVAAYKSDQIEKGRLVSFINDIQLVTKSEDIKSEVTRFAKTIIPDAENVVFRTEFDFENFPFSQEDIQNEKLIQLIREYDENGDPLPDEDFTHYLLLDEDKSINGVLTVQSISSVVSKNEIDEINAYVGFLKKTREFITRQIAYDSLAKYAHTSKNFFLKLVGEINGIIDTENPKLKAAIESLYVESEKMLDRKIDRGKEISDYLLSTKLEKLSKKISAYANFYKATDLNFKQISDGDFSSFNLAEIIQECKGIAGEIKITKPEIDVTIYGKKEAIRQGFIDLIQNAIEYSPVSTVNIEIVSYQNFVLVSVTNEVTNILPEETYEKLGNQWLTAQNDVGISKGMYWAKQAIENSNGQFEICPYEIYKKNKIFGITLKFKQVL